jgi:F-type H+-transporting ATPase subunit a
MGDLLQTGTSLLAAAEGGHHGPSFLGLMIYVVLVLGILFGLMAHAKKGMGKRVFRNPITQLFEQLYLFIENLCVGTIGPHGRKYIPVIGTFWMVIFIGNLVALFMPTSPTADLSFNLAMALIAVGYVQVEGVKANGLVGHLSHFAGPKLPIAMAIIITPIIFSIEIISELMKNVSLSLRLFGNINGGHQAVESMNVLGEGIYVPFGVFLLPIKLLTCVVQALVFSLLTCVYLSLVTAHHDDHEEGHGAEAHAH